MKNLCFVSVVLIFLSGTSLSATAQKSPKFIDGIEINPEAGTGINVAASTYDAAKIPAIKSVNKLAATKEVLFTEECSAVQFKYAQILNRDVESLTNTALFKFIDEWWATHYRYGGTTKAGIDCSAFAGLLLNTVYGIKLPRTAKDEYAACTKIDKEEMQEGDMIFFNTRGGISHVGIYLGEGYFVHASVSNGVTINNLDDNYYGHRFIGAGRPGSEISKVVIK
ncbi:MAG: C40 family peptidase [Ferruginibacter sp.]